MSFIKNPGSIIVWNPFDTTYYYAKHYQTFTGLGKDKMHSVYLDLSISDGECFLAESPYPSYRIKEWNILLEPDPALCYNGGILWKNPPYYMFINHQSELILTNDVIPGAFLSQDETFQENGYWILTQAWAGTISSDVFTGVHNKDTSQNVTVIKEFPRWIRRHDGSKYHRENAPCGYYDPDGGAEGVLLIGTPIEPESYTDKLYDGKESTVVAYMGEAITWKQ